MMEESIYNLIQPEYEPIQKKKHYKSKYPYNIPPTASTFCNKTTSRPDVANLNGEYQLVRGPHESKGKTSTFGTKLGEAKPNPSEYIKKKSDPEKQQSNDEDIEGKFTYTDKQKPAVPKKDEKPLMNLQSNKNFVVLNAVENILSAPKPMPQKTDYLKKSDYGKKPQYLTDLQKQIQQEYQLIQNMETQQMEEMEKKRVLLSEQEVQELKAGLKAKYDQIEKEYQTLTYKVIDTIGLKRKKQNCERDLQILEKDMEKLNKQYIFIDNS